MDLRALRADLGVVANEAGYSSWDYQPDSLQDLPAAVVGSPQSMRRLNQIVTEVKVPITFYVSEQDPQDATARLDLALSAGLPDSFIDMLDSVHAADGPSWRSVVFESAGPYQRVIFDGGGSALFVEVLLSLTA